MKKGLYVLLIFAFTSLTSFTVMRRLNVSVRFEKLETSNDSLKLEFKISYPNSEIKAHSGGNIEILKNDSLFLRIVSNSAKTPIDFWKFPSIPDEYRIVYPENTENFPYFSKADNFTFIFSAFGVYFGTWEYKPYYSDEKSKWLFDESGNQIVTIKSNYEPWLFGSDIIKIKSDESFFIEKLYIQVLDEENKNLEFEVKYKKNPTNIIALKLKNKEKKGSKLKLVIQFDKDKHYEEYILVSDRSIVNIAGKYGDL